MKGLGFRIRFSLGFLLEWKSMKKEMENEMKTGSL